MRPNHAVIPVLGSIMPFLIPFGLMFTFKMFPFSWANFIELLFLYTKTGVLKINDHLYLLQPESAQVEPPYQSWSQMLSILWRRGFLQGIRLPGDQSQFNPPSRYKCTRTKLKAVFLRGFWQWIGRTKRQFAVVISGNHIDLRSKNDHWTVKLTYRLCVDQASCLRGLAFWVQQMQGNLPFG